jgi:16S rRNA (uracil1498-N3)-methyltransferase
MQRHRFYAPPSQISGTHITLDADEAHHLTRVLRLPVGARVFAFDGCGHEYACQIATADKRNATLAIVEPLPGAVESPLQLTLAQALLKNDKFDWVVQKITELGVTRLVPLLTEHCDIRKAEERADARLQRWRRIALEAVKQCGRRRLLDIAEPLSWAEYCAQTSTNGLNLIFSERGGQKLNTLPSTATAVSVAIASEGGWSEAELQLADQHGFTPIHLGPRILRAETAAVAGAALLQQRFGDM